MTDDEYAVADEQVADSATQGPSLRSRVEHDLDPQAEPDQTVPDGDSVDEPGVARERTAS